MGPEIEKARCASLVRFLGMGAGVGDAGGGTYDSGM